MRFPGSNQAETETKYLSSFVIITSIKCDNENLIKIGNMYYTTLFTRSLHSLHSILTSTDTTFHHHMLLLLARVPVLGAPVLGLASNDLVTMTIVDSAPDTLLVTHDTLLRSETSEERGMTGVSVSLCITLRPCPRPLSSVTINSLVPAGPQSVLDSSRMVRV